MYTVLIVEDEVLVSAGLKNMIHWSEMDMMIVGEARNGKQGLEMYHQMKPDVILTDLKMPVLDGMEMITQIRKEDTVTKIIVLSCYEDFELVRQAFKLGVSDYILKLKMLPKEMEQVIKKVYEELVSEQVHSKSAIKLEKEIINKNEIKRKCRDFIINQTGQKDEFCTLANSLRISEKGLLICAMDAIPRRQLRDESEKERYLERVQQIIINLVGDLLLEYEYGEIIPEKQNRYFLLLSFGDKDECEQKKLLETLMSRISIAVQTYINAKVVFGISSCGGSYAEIHKLYNEAVEALGEANFLEESCTFCEVKNNQEKYAIIWEDFENQIADMEDLPGDYRKKIFSELSYLRNEKYLKTTDVKGVFIRWIHGVSLESLVRKENMLQLAMETVRKIGTAVSFKDTVNLFEEYLQAVNKYKSAAKFASREVAAVVAFVENHYRESDLSLTRAAHEVGMNKDYLSSLFKKEVGVSFSDYVNIQRVRKAKELLTSTHMKVYKIALDVGFRDESYFSRVFRKIEGVRPNEYKKRAIVSEERK